MLLRLPHGLVLPKHYKMKTLIKLALFTILAVSVIAVSAQDELNPYFKVGTLSATVDGAGSQAEAALKELGFEILGSYNPGGNNQLKVIAYTRKDLQDVCLKVKDRGVLASILKVGIKQNGQQADVSMLNPTYLFYAYLREETDNHIAELNRISADARKAMENLGSDFTGFGGSEEADDLKDYHYMAFMPYFDDPVDLKTFDSFEKGVATIKKNLAARKGNTLQVFELVLADKKMAVFGVGLLDAEDGEAKFLPIIGEDNLAAMPYEIVLMDNKATMLHGKFRIALHWPELSMGQFMKISSTPGDIEDFMQALTE